MTHTPVLSVVIPAYNEALRIVNTLERVIAYLERQSYRSEIIVVDDGSFDQTVPVVLNILNHVEGGTLLQNGQNRGKGYSVRQGVLASRGQYVLFSDADLSTPIEEVEKLLPRVRADADIAIGSRGLRSSDVQVHQPFYRELMGKTFNGILRLLGLSQFHDTQCGFKCFRGDAARELFARQTLDHYSFDVEVLLLADMRGYRIEEVPVRWFNEPNSRVSAIKDSARMFADVLKIRANMRTGVYDDPL